MSTEDLLLYDVSEVNLYFEDGEAIIELPQKKIINEKVAVSRNKLNDEENQNR